MVEIDGQMMVDIILKSPRCLCTYVAGNELGIIVKGTFTTEQLDGHYNALREYMDKLTERYINKAWIKKRGEK